jgi:hypothetical protein
MVESVGALVVVLEAAEPAQRAALYESLGLALTYEPSKRRVLVEADLSGVHPVRVGGPWRTSPTPFVVRGELQLLP